ncbi:MAG: TIGR00296 family protein [Candidatus Bathyarchaeota archaeon]|nr:TIGR00296 family protein [Candidatus Termiticorpusculum sp.]MCL1970746.1 TIGR00296 family protein [Candidatus Termiticorpusculum sp.]
MFELTDDSGKFLVKLARDTVEAFLKTGCTSELSSDVLQRFYMKCGVFVTISMFDRGEKVLRGCIGYPYPTSSLVDAVVNSAINAATGDPRFPSMVFEELDRCVFDVSVLTPPELIQVDNPKEYIQHIKVGRDGLIVEKGGNKGLLLPQVPVEWQWSEEEFLCQCCMKAGLLPDSWLVSGIKIYRFAAIIFEELEPKGEIKRSNLHGTC